MVSLVQNFEIVPFEKKKKKKTNLLLLLLTYSNVKKHKMLQDPKDTIYKY